MNTFSKLFPYTFPSELFAINYFLYCFLHVILECPEIHYSLHSQCFNFYFFIMFLSNMTFKVYGCFKPLLQIWHFCLLCFLLTFRDFFCCNYSHKTYKRCVLLSARYCNTANQESLKAKQEQYKII